MNPFDIVKNTLQINLEKNGHTLQDFESALRELNTGEGVLKTAQFVKLASDEKNSLVDLAKGVTMNPVGSALGTAGNAISNWYLPATMGAGALLGLGVDAAEGTVRDQNKRLGELRRNIDIMRKIKDNTAIEHGLQKKK